MIVYASPKTQGTDSEGNTQPISIVSADQDQSRIADCESRDLLENIVEELKIMNVQLSNMTDMVIDKEDIG